MKPVFVTDHGVQVPAVTAEQMREIDRIAVEEAGPNSNSRQRETQH